MVEPALELGSEPKSLPRGSSSRRRLFEGGSGVIPSSFSHKSPLDLHHEASSVHEQAASLSNLAVIESIQENNSPLEEVEDEIDFDDHSQAETRLDNSFSASFTSGPHVIDDHSRSERDASFSDHQSLSQRANFYPQISNHSEHVDMQHHHHNHQHHHVHAEPKHSSITVTKLVSYIPSVLVGSLLNILDGLSYGMILFPLGTAVFSGLESAGLSLFYTSTIISQLVFSLGGSGFKACIGSEMIEIVPFFHALSLSIAHKLDGCPQEEILATTITSFAVSCVITGLTFFILGWLKLGDLVGFFPLHILLGCIGGVGWFLIATGFEVSSRLEGGIEYNYATLGHLFGSFQVIAQWGSCLALGALLMFAERRLHHPLVVPSILVSTFVLFHVIVAVIPGLSLDSVRANGWVFPAQEAGEPWYWIYEFYRPSLIHIRPILECLPIMLALNFFGIIHVPINIPALAAAIKEDSFNVNQELIAHGISNTLSGLCGSIQNYLVYTNSVMFIKSGADSPVAGVMLAIATTGIMLTGPVIIGYIPVIVVGSLIFMMGFDLMTEALVDTYGSVRKQDYATMVAITLIMGCYDFVTGIVAGIVLACLFFVIMSARRSPIVSEMSGEHVHSTVIRHPVLQQYLLKVGKQVYILRLSGPLFFGTNGTLEREVRRLCNCHSNEGAASFKYLVIDLENVNDIDYCTVDTFLRLKRLLDSCRIRLVLSGAETAGHKIRGLKAVDLVAEVVDFNDPLSVRVFSSLNTALSWCENQFIKEYYYHHSAHLNHRHDSSARRSSTPPPDFPAKPTSVPTISKWGMSEYGMDASSPGLAAPEMSLLGTTPRTSYVRNAARSIAREDVDMVNKWQRHQQPVPLLMQIVGSVSNKDVSFWMKLAPYLEKTILAPSELLPLGFHLIEAGVLHIQYPSGYFETALAGTCVGELTPQMKREVEIRSERDTVVWTLSQKSIRDIKSVENGFELLSELLAVHLVLMSDRYTRVTDYYRIAAFS